MSNQATAIANLVTDNGPKATLRIGLVTTVETTGSMRVQVDTMAGTWLSRDADAQLAVGDRVWFLQQGSVNVVGGRLSPGPEFVPVGTVVMYTAPTAPNGWMICDGSAVSRTTYADLYAVIGTFYGAGNGSTTFNLPNFVARFPLGASSGRGRGSTGGAETVTLTTTNMPAHTHSPFSADDSGFHSHTINNTGSQHSHDVLMGNDVATTGQNSRIASALASSAFTAFNSPAISDGSHTHFAVSAGTHSHALNLTTQGGDGAHENMPPYLAINFMIRMA